MEYHPHAVSNPVYLEFGRLGGLQTMANWFGSALKAAGHAASSFSKSVSETANSLTTAAGGTAGTLGKNISKTTSHLSTAAGGAANTLGKTIGKTASSVIDAVQGWLPFSNQDTLAFFAVLFAVAAADNTIDEAELSMILSSPEANKLSKEEKKTLQSYSYNPPALSEAIKGLADASPELKFGLIFCILNLLRINGAMTPAEEEALKIAQQEFEINDVQLNAIESFIKVLAEARNEHTPEAIAAVKAATERMEKVGVPVGALAYSQESEADEMNYSDEKFVEKMKAFGLQAGKGLVEQAFVLWYALHAPQTPVSAKLTIAGALAYWILPVDLLPDILPAVGFTDDFTTIASAIASIAMSITPDMRAKAKQQTDALFSGKNVFKSGSKAALDDV